MEAMRMMFTVLLLLSVCSRVEIIFALREYGAGNAQHCSQSDLQVTQIALPGMIRYQTVYQVTVENQCICKQSNIKVTCVGFTSDMGVDPAIIWPDGDGKLCTLNNGGAVGMGPENAIMFRYATKNNPIQFKPVNSTIACS